MTATFRLSTANDLQLIHSNRRSRLSAKACRMCRARKVKCDLGGNSSEQPCRACRQANLDCLWDTTDDRKRRKLHVGHEQVADRSIEAHPPQTGGSSIEHSPVEVCESACQDEAPTRTSKTILSVCLGQPTLQLHSTTASLRCRGTRLESKRWTMKA